MVSDNSISVMDRGYASWSFIKQISDAKINFVLRIRNNMRTKLQHNKYRVVKSYGNENIEYRLATNLAEFSGEAVADIYRKH